MKLVKSKVKFIGDSHQYWLGDKQLYGITGMIDHYINHDKFKNLNDSARTQDAVESARANGSAVHKQIQYIIDHKFKIDEDFLSLSTKEASDFVQFVENSGIKFACSEYLVSDEDYYASSIDLVDKSNNLYDIKTNKTLEKEAVRWQLSIYKYLFELQNPGLSAGRLYAIHLNGDKAELVEVEAICKEEVLKLLEANKAGADYVSPFESFGDNSEELMEDYIDADDKLKIAEGQKKALLAQFKDQLDTIDRVIKSEKSRKENLRGKIESQMRERHVYSARGNGWSVSRTMDSTKMVFDEARFAAEKAKVYAKYQKEVTVDGGIRVTKSRK